MGAAVVMGALREIRKLRGRRRTYKGRILRCTLMHDPTAVILDGNVDRLGNVVLDRLCYIGNLGGLQLSIILALSETS